MEPQKSPTPTTHAACTNTPTSTPGQLRNKEGARFCKAEAISKMNSATQSKDPGLEVAQGPSPDHSAQCPSAPPSASLVDELHSSSIPRCP